MLLKQLDTLSQSKQLSVAALQSIPDSTILHSKNCDSDNPESASSTITISLSGTTSPLSKKWTSSNSSGSNKKNDEQSHYNANLIILATHVLNRVMMQLNTLNKKEEDGKNNKGNSNTDDNDKQKRYYAMILSVYSSILSKILLIDKTQLERIINTSTTTTTSGNKKSKSNTNEEVDEGYDAKSVLGRALLSSMLSSLQSMHILSSSNIDKPDKFYAKLMWKNANVIEALLGLGSNYRSILKGNTKNSKSLSGISSSISGPSGGILNVNTVQSSVFASGTGINISTGNSSDSIHGVSNNISGTSNNNSVATSVHSIPMDKNRANIWNEICTAMECDIDSKNRKSDDKHYTSLLIENETLVEALSVCNQKLWQLSPADVTLEEAIIKLISFRDQNDNMDQDSNDNNDVSKPATKRRKTDSSSTSTRTRSKTLSDKSNKKSNEYNLLSAQVSELIYRFKDSTVALGGSRFNLKKWASSSFVWACNGPEMAIESLCNLFMKMNNSMNGKNTDWHEIMQVSVVINDTAAAKTKTKKKGKNATSAEHTRGSSATLQTKGSIVKIPGNVVLITFASRVIDIVNESGKSSGSTLPRNGVEHYVNALMDVSNDDDAAIVHASPKSTSSSTKSRRQAARKGKDSTASSPFRTDVKADVVMSSDGKSKAKGLNNKHKGFCNLTILLMELLLEAHHDCLSNNVSSTTSKASSHEEPFEITRLAPKFPLKPGEILGHALLNDDNFSGDGGMANSLLNHRCSVLAECRMFPQIHKTIETLINCVSACTVSTNGNADSVTRLTGIGGAIAMKYATVVKKLTGKECKVQSKGGQFSSQNENVNTVIIIDAKLCSWAVSHLSVCVSNILSLSKRASMDVDTDLKNNELTTDLVQRFSLDSPLTFINHTNEPSTQDYLGLFGDKGNAGNAQDEISVVDAISEKNKVQGDILALFVRVFLPNKKGGTKDASSKAMLLGLTETLLRIITCCYSLDTYVVGAMYHRR